MTAKQRNASGKCPMRFVFLKKLPCQPFAHFEQYGALAP